MSLQRLFCVYLAAVVTVLPVMSSLCPHLAADSTTLFLAYSVMDIKF